MRLQIQSLAFLSGLRIRHWSSCGVDGRCGSDPVLLWLWRRPAATALIPPLAWEPPYAVGSSPRKKTKKKKELNSVGTMSSFHTFSHMPGTSGNKSQVSNLVELKVWVFFWCVCLFCFLGLYLWHVEVPRLGVKLELQLLAYTTATAMQDLSLVCDLHHSSPKC